MRDRAAAVFPGPGKATVGNCLARARGQVYSGRCRVPWTWQGNRRELSGAGAWPGLFWPLPPERNDDSLELLRFSGPALALRPDRPVPDWAVMDVALRRPRVTRALLREEYRTQSPDGFGHAWFGGHFDAWKGRMRPRSHQRCAFSAMRQRCAFSAMRQRCAFSAMRHRCAFSAMRHRCAFSAMRQTHWAARRHSSTLPVTRSM